MADTPATTWAIGDFAMGNGMAVRVIGLTDKGVPNHLEFVSDYENGVGICCGGCVIGLHPDLAPITSPVIYLRCQAYRAIVEIRQAKERIFALERERDINIAAMAAIRATKA